MKKYIVLLASLLIQACLGGIYAWSVFVPPLRDAYGLTTTQTQLIFGVMILSFTVTMILAGRLQDRFSPRIIATIGGILFGIGYILASFSKGSFILLLLKIGLISGAGIGFGYVCPLTTCMKWFPRHKGIITGVAVAGFGLGAIILSSIVAILLNKTIDVLRIFLWIGIIYGIIVISAAIFLFSPEKLNKNLKKNNSAISNLFKEHLFWALMIGMFTGTFAGLLIIGNLKPIAINNNIDMYYATVAISTFAIGNALGRILWGWFFDKFGSKIIPLSLIFLGIVISCLLVNTVNLLFVINSLLIGFCFGACFVIYAAQVASKYGADKVGTIYPIVFLTYGISGLLGPALGGWIFDVVNNYHISIFIAAALAGSGGILTWKLQEG